VWHAVGGYWRGVADDEHGMRWEGTEELARFRDPSIRARSANAVRRARKIDSESIRDLEAAYDDWDRCLGHGRLHPCPCMGPTACARV
jgi:hypothetical protein